MYRGHAQKRRVRQPNKIWKVWSDAVKKDLKREKVSELWGEKVGRLGDNLKNNETRGTQRGSKSVRFRHHQGRRVWVKWKHEKGFFKTDGQYRKADNQRKARSISIKDPAIRVRCKGKKNPGGERPRDGVSTKEKGNERLEKAPKSIFQRVRISRVGKVEYVRRKVFRRGGVYARSRSNGDRNHPSSDD